RNDLVHLAAKRVVGEADVRLDGTRRQTRLAVLGRAQFRDQSIRSVVDSAPLDQRRRRPNKRLPFRACLVVEIPSPHCSVITNAGDAAIRVCLSCRVYEIGDVRVGLPVATRAIDAKDSVEAAECGRPAPLFTVYEADLAIVAVPTVEAVDAQACID